MPRTLAQNAQYIAETIKPAIKSAIEAQGVTVPSTDSFLDYADRIGEIEGGGSGYQLKDLPTGSIATVNDAASLPLNALKVSVEAWQEGSGDPSPSNIRPIHGWDSGEIGVVGKNWLPCEAISTTELGIQFDVLADKKVYVERVNRLFQLVFCNYGHVYLKAGTYKVNGVTGGGAATFYIEFLKNSYTGTRLTYITDGDNALILTEPTEVYVRLVIASSGLPNLGDNTTFAPMIRLVTETATTYEPYKGNQYTQQFPTTIYGAEWDVVGGELKQTDGYIASYNGEALPSTWISDRDVYASGTTPTTGAEVVYKLATPTIIDLSPLSIRMLQGVNNVYADCGEVIEGEYFVDEGAIDVRKVDYSIGSNSALKISDGRIIQGFANMSNYGIFPRDASNNWLDVDWNEDFEIGSAFKVLAFPSGGNATIFGCGVSGSMNYAPNVYFWNGSTAYITLSENGSSSAVDTALNYTFQTDTWYFVRAKFTASTLNLKIEVSTDMSNFTTVYNDTLAAAPYHDAASICIGGMAQSANYASNSILIDTFNTYVKGDGVSWGAFTGAFPS